MIKKIEIKLNTSLRGKKQGDIIKLEIDKSGIVKDRYWRRRIADSKIDNCVEIVKKKKGSN